MRYLLLFTITLGLSCAQKVNPASGADVAEVYKSTYQLSVTLKNPEAESGVFLPELYLQMTWEVISDGVQSYVHAFIEEATGTIKIQSDDTLYAYTNCDKGIILKMDNTNAVQEAFRLRSCGFAHREKHVVTILNTSFNVDVLDATQCTDMTVYASQTLPASINMGSCYLRGLSSALMKMTGDQQGTQFDAELVGYQRHPFDFSVFSEKLNTYGDTSGLKEFHLLGL